MVTRGALTSCNLRPQLSKWQSAISTWQMRVWAQYRPSRGKFRLNTWQLMMYNEYTRIISFNQQYSVMKHWTTQLWVYVMVCRLFSSKPFCQFEPIWRNTNTILINRLFLFQGNAFWNIVCHMASIVFRLSYVKNRASMLLFPKSGIIWQHKVVAGLENKMLPCDRSDIIKPPGNLEVAMTLKGIESGMKRAYITG